MFYIISIPNDEYTNQETDFLFNEYPDVCEGHLRIGDVNAEFASLFCELYMVYEEMEFLQLVKMMQKNIPHLEAFKKCK